MARTKLVDVCTASGCNKPYSYSGYCNMHNERLKRHGTLGLPPKSPSRLIGRFNDQTPRWKGDDVDYTTIHKWLTKEYGSFKDSCSQCGRTNTRIEWANITGVHARNIENYLPMCVPCHRKLDLYRTHCPQGHELSGYNLKLTKEGWRNCRTCAVTKTREHRAKLKALSGAIN